MGKGREEEKKRERERDGFDTTTKAAIREDERDVISFRFAASVKVIPEEEEEEEGAVFCFFGERRSDRLCR